jgi:very-short-patch-repair endonuclease
MSAPFAPAASRVNAIASPRHGVITLDELLDAGIAPSTTRDWVASGRIHRLHRGVFAIVPPALLSREGRWLAAVLACGPGAVLSHGAAAQLLGILTRRDRPGIHVSLLDRRRIRPTGIIVHRPRHLERCDLTARRRIPVTSATRTIFDQASLIGRSALRAQFEQAEYLELLDRPRLNELLTGATGRRGLGQLRELAGFTPMPLSRVRSGLERIVLSLCRAHSLPMPAVNVPLLGYEVDFLWEAARLVVEADGGHHVGDRRERDNERDLALQRAGYLVRRYTEQALSDGDAVASELLALLRERLPATV